MLLKPGVDALSEVVSLCRAALTPFMANNSLGVDSYKWILYGDDDTVSFLHGGWALWSMLKAWLPFTQHTTLCRQSCAL